MARIPRFKPHAGITVNIRLRSFVFPGVLATGLKKKQRQRGEDEQFGFHIYGYSLRLLTSLRRTMFKQLPLVLCGNWFLY